MAAPIQESGGGTSGGFPRPRLTPEMIAQAWRDDLYLQTLPAELRGQVPRNPAGELDLGVVLRGGEIGEVHFGTVAPSCSTVAPSCSTVAVNCSTVGVKCSTVAATCSTVAAECSTVAAKCSTVAPSCSTVAPRCSTVAPGCKGRGTRQ